MASVHLAPPALCSVCRVLSWSPPPRLLGPGGVPLPASHVWLSDTHLLTHAHTRRTFCFQALHVQTKETGRAAASLIKIILSKKISPNRWLCHKIKAHNIVERNSVWSVPFNLCTDDKVFWGLKKRSMKNIAVFIISSMHSNWIIYYWLQTRTRLLLTSAADRRIRIKDVSNLFRLSSNGNW